MYNHIDDYFYMVPLQEIFVSSIFFFIKIYIKYLTIAIIVKCYKII